MQTPVAAASRRSGRCTTVKWVYGRTTVPTPGSAGTGSGTGVPRKCSSYPCRSPRDRAAAASGAGAGESSDGLMSGPYHRAVRARRGHGGRHSDAPPGTIRRSGPVRGVARGPAVGTAPVHGTDGTRRGGPAAPPPGVLPAPSHPRYGPRRTTDTLRSCHGHRPIPAHRTQQRRPGPVRRLGRPAGGLRERRPGHGPDRPCRRIRGHGGAHRRRHGGERRRRTGPGGPGAGPRRHLPPHLLGPRRPAPGHRQGPGGRPARRDPGPLRPGVPRRRAGPGVLVLRRRCTDPDVPRLLPQRDRHRAARRHGRSLAPADAAGPAAGGLRAGPGAVRRDPAGPGRVRRAAGRERPADLRLPGPPGRLRRAGQREVHRDPAGGLGRRRLRRRRVPGLPPGDPAPHAPGPEPEPVHVGTGRRGLPGAAPVHRPNRSRRPA